MPALQADNLPALLGLTGQATLTPLAGGLESYVIQTDDGRTITGEIMIAPGGREGGRNKTLLAITENDGVIQTNWTLSLLENPDGTLGMIEGSKPSTSIVR